MSESQRDDFKVQPVPPHWHVRLYVVATPNTGTYVKPGEEVEFSSGEETWRAPISDFAYEQLGQIHFDVISLRRPFNVDAVLCTPRKGVSGRAIILAIH